MHVFFAHTLEEAEWVRTQISLENSQTFKIIATSLATQFFFFKKGIPADDGSTFLSKRFYSHRLEVLVRKSQYWYRKLRPYFKSITVSEIYLYDLLQTSLESAFLSVFYSEFLLRQIQANISSPHFYISAFADWQLGRWDPTQSTVAAYIKDNKLTFIWPDHRAQIPTFSFSPPFYYGPSLIMAGELNLDTLEFKEHIIGYNVKNLQDLYGKDFGKDFKSTEITIMGIMK